MRAACGRPYVAGLLTAAMVLFGSAPATFHRFRIAALTGRLRATGEAGAWRARLHRIDLSE
jgi:hypothetical protein